MRLRSELRQQREMQGTQGSRSIVRLGGRQEVAADRRREDFPSLSPSPSGGAASRERGLRDEIAKLRRHLGAASPRRSHRQKRRQEAEGGDATVAQLADVFRDVSASLPADNWLVVEAERMWREARGKKQEAKAPAIQLREAENQLAKKIRAVEAA